MLIPYALFLHVLTVRSLVYDQPLLALQLWRQFCHSTETITGSIIGMLLACL